MTLDAPRVRVVVLNYRAAALTERCVEHLVAQTHPAVEIVVIDNASHDDVAERIRSRWPDIRVVVNDDNRGFGAGCNRGLTLPGRVDAFALVNNDSAPRPDWLERLVDVWQHPPATSGRVGAVAGKVLLADSGLVNSVGCELRPGGFNADRGDGQPDDGTWDDEVEVFGWSGASVLLDAALVADIGPFDERFFLYYEDVEMVWRSRRRGWSTVCAPRAVSMHERGASAGRGEMFQYLDARNRLMVLALHAPWRWLVRAVAVQCRLIVTPDPAGPSRAVRSRALGAVLVRLPALLRDRRRLDRRATVDRRAAAGDR